MDFRKFTVLIIIISVWQTVRGQQSQNVLDCNFDQQNFCRWTNGVNGVEDDFDWRIDNTAPIDGFHSIPRTVTGTGFFAYAQGRFRPTETEAARAWLLSPVINGLANPATVNFVYWKTAAPPVLQTCIRDSGDNRLRCFDTVSGLGDPKWVQKAVTIPSNSLPFQIVLVALGFRTALDLVGIDDLTVRYANGETLGRLIDGSGSNNIVAAYPAAVPPSAPPLYPQPGAAIPSFYNRPVPGVPPSGPPVYPQNPQSYPGGLSNVPPQPYPGGINPNIQPQPYPGGVQPVFPPQPFPGPTLPIGQQPFYPQPFPGALGPSPGGQVSFQPVPVPSSRAPFTTGQIVNPSNAYGTPGVQPPVEPTRYLPQTVFTQGLEPRREIQTQFPRTQEPSYVFITQEPIFTRQPIYFTTGTPQYSLPNPRPFTPNPYFVPQPPTERQVSNPVPSPPPVEPNHIPPSPPVEPNPIPPSHPAEPNPIPPIERNPTGSPIVINPSTTPAYRHPVGVEEPGEENKEPRTTHDHRFYFTTSSPEGRQAHETTPRLAVKVDPVEAASGQCSAVACPFNKDFCKWYNDLSSNFDWKLKYAPVPYQGAGYIFVSGDFRKFEQRASIKSPTFVVPADSVLEFLAFISDSDSGRLSVYIDDSSNPDNLLWKATGHKSLGGTGWRRIRVPLPASSYPTTLALICDQLTLGQFVGLDDVRLTDKSGFDIGCASDSAFPESTLSPRIQSIQPIPPLVSEASIAKISEAPIRESAVFAKSRVPFVFVDPTRSTGRTRQESTTDATRTSRSEQSSRLAATRSSLPKFENNNDESDLENNQQLENYGERIGYTSIENRLKKDQIVDYGWGTIRVNDFRTTLFPGKKLRRTRNKTEAVDNGTGLKLKDQEVTEYGSTIEPVKNISLVKKAVTPVADPLGLKDFVLQISRDLRDMFGQSTNRLNLNSLYNYPIF